MLKFQKRYKINFPLLCDPEFHAIEAYGARRMKQFLGKSFLGIVRSTFLIGPDRRIERVWEKAPSKGHATEVLEALGQSAEETESKTGCDAECKPS